MDWDKLGYASLKEYQDYTCQYSGKQNCHYNCNECREVDQYSHVGNEMNNPKEIVKIKPATRGEETDREKISTRRISPMCGCDITYVNNDKSQILDIGEGIGNIIIIMSDSFEIRRSQHEAIQKYLFDHDYHWIGAKTDRAYWVTCPVIVLNKGIITPCMGEDCIECHGCNKTKIKAEEFINKYIISENRPIPKSSFKVHMTLSTKEAEYENIQTPGWIMGACNDQKKRLEEIAKDMAVAFGGDSKELIKKIGDDLDFTVKEPINRGHLDNLKFLYARCIEKGGGGYE